MSGCCYGREYNGIFSVQFPYNESIPGLDSVRRIPVQIIEAGLNFIAAIVLLILAYKAVLKQGQLLGIYIVYYTIARFFIEMLRGDEIRGVIYGISTSQIISIILLPIGIVLLCGKLTKIINVMSIRKNRKMK
jgi:phosphatidylglycerol:prolipoprotein diacylglycerol transferase